MPQRKSNRSTSAPAAPRSFGTALPSLADRFDVEVADGSGGADTFLDALAALLLDLAAKQMGRAGGKSA